MMARMDRLLPEVAQALLVVMSGMLSVWLLVQQALAQRYHRRFRLRAPTALQSQDAAQRVDVIVTCYNEDPALLEACCDSLMKQDYNGELNVYVVDDSSWNQRELRAVMHRYRHLSNWNLKLLSSNVGKRRAQDTAFRLGSGELVVTLDSDTFLEPEAIARIAEAFCDQQVGVVTGSCLPLNVGRNLLTRLIGVRYGWLFSQQRAAQSWFSAVLCCHGAFSAYRRLILTQCWDAYQHQVYRGVVCTTGDDLHLTNLVLAAGYDSLYAPPARAYTRVPETVREFARQQLRWNRSFYRELSWTRRALRGRSRYLMAEVVRQAVMPLAILTGLGIVAARLLDGAPWPLLGDVELAGVLLLVCAALVAWQTRTAYVCMYALFYLLLLPICVKAVITRGASRWETRRYPRS